ncbi:MAG: arylsulfatase, partial [Cyclobacteriaceae bacterium]|nr:arylsulfatase [Cyclobacteriaceae bacterium]
SNAPEKHTVQYFEMFGNRGVYENGWLARTIHRAPWLPTPPQTLQEDIWDLYNTTEDFSLVNNLASENPEKSKEMQALFMKEAEKYHVLPIDDRLLIRTNAEAVGRPTVLGNRNTVNYVEGMRGMGPDVFIDLRSKAYTMTAEVEVAANGNGVIVCQGGRFGGLTFYMKDGKPAFGYNYLGLESTNIVSNQALSAGKYTLVYDFAYDGGGPGKGGTGTLTVNGKKVAEGRIERTQPGLFSVDDMADVGMDEGTQVVNYGGSDKFTGKIHKITIDKKEEKK